MITKFKKPISSLLSQVPKCLASSVPQGPSGSNVVKFESGQFSKKRLTDFGELPTGQIPDALQYDHPHGKFIFKTKKIKKNFIEKFIKFVNPKKFQKIKNNNIFEMSELLNCF